MAAPTGNHYYLVGWREWVEFPEFANARVKAKVDTGARTSAIHAEDIVFDEASSTVSFTIFPNQDDEEAAVRCHAPLIEQREITDSGGHSQERFVVQVTIGIGAHVFPIELSLTHRDTMGFRMLLGRTALKRRFLVQPGRSYLGGAAIPKI